MLAVVFALMLQQAVPGTVAWEEPAPPPMVASNVAPRLPASALADPFGYERAQCSPLIRSASETMEACQSRVRSAFAAHGQNAGSASGADSANCRQETAGDRYALQCGPPPRADRPTTTMSERTCETRPQAQPGGGVTWTETCRQDDGRPAEQDGLKFRLGGRD